MFLDYLFDDENPYSFNNNMYAEIELKHLRGKTKSQFKNAWCVLHGRKKDRGHLKDKIMKEYNDAKNDPIQKLIVNKFIEILSRGE